MADANPDWVNKPKTPGYPKKKKIRGHDLARIRTLQKVLMNMKTRDVKNLPTDNTTGFKSVPYFDPLDTDINECVNKLIDHMDYLRTFPR